VITVSYENPLPILAEIRTYKTRGLLKDEHFLAAYNSVLRDEQKATTLATAAEEQKKEAIAQWLPKQ
jgi:hypothetical protein